MVYDKKIQIQDNPFKTLRAVVILMSVFGFLIHDLSACQNDAVGVADSSIIPDDRFTASSYYTRNAADTRYKPKNARLNGATGWGPKTTTDPNDYLQIDLGQVFVICAVATQGHGTGGYTEWTKQYKIATSLNNVNWTTLKNGSTDKLFPGNTDRNTVVKNGLDYPVLVRYMRFVPTTYNSWKVLRVEAYGFGKDYSFLPVGIGSRKIPDSDMTASSSYNSTTSPSKARLNYTAGSSWCAATSDSSPYLQINLGSPYIICGIATQGDHMTDQWVQSYNMLTSNDGSTFTKYMENGRVKVFPSNFEPDTAVKNLLYDGTVGQYIRVAPTSHYGSTNCMRTEVYGIKQNGGCANMFVGIADPSIIPDHRFTASSCYDNRYIPSNARLNTSSSWAPRTTAGGDWLQIDIGHLMIVCALATQGSSGHVHEWAKSYKIRVSLDNVNWKYYQENSVDKRFTANTNKEDIVKNSLANPTKAKFIRFYPLSFHTWPTMRVEVFGLSSVCSSPVGLEIPGTIIQNSQMTSSSQLDSTHNASYGRLYGNNSWCSITTSNTEYLQIDLGQVMTVTGIATQGDNITDKWVWTYRISYSVDGILWNTYKDGGNSDKNFQGNTDKDSVRAQWLAYPVTARHVRVNPRTWNTGICMRIELYGCDYANRPLMTGLTNQNLTAAANSYVDLVCIVQDPLIQYIKWYNGNTDITSQSTGLVRGANGVKQSTLRVNYTSDADVFASYDCFRSKSSLFCYKAFNCRAMYGNTKINADGMKSAGIKIQYDYPSTQPKPTVTFRSSELVGIVWQKLPLNKYQRPVTSYVLVYNNDTYSKTIIISAHSLVITGLRIYSRYKITMKAVSIIGDGKWSQPMNFITESTIPTGFPTRIKAVALTSQSIRLTWQAPTSGINGPFLGYKVFCISGPKTTTTPQQTSHTFTGLRKWTVYNVTVVIRNDKGDGPINAYVIRRTLEDAPGPPQKFQVTVINSTSVQVDWALPSETNGVIRGFKLRYEKTGSSSSRNIPGTMTYSYVVTGLDKCTQYSFTILAYTIKDGPYTSVVQKTTAEDAPSVPTNIVGNIIKPNGPSDPQVTLTWRKPVVCGDNIRHYKVSYSHSEDHTLKVLTVDSSRLSVTIPVWGGVTYEFRIKGITNKEGPDSIKETLMIPDYVSGVSPSNLTFGDVNGTTFKVSWEEIPRSESNGRVIAYEVSQTLVRRGRARRSSDNVGQVKLVNSSCCSLYLHDLLVCAEYHISVKGYTSAGAGPNSDIKTLKTSVPGSPIGLIAQTIKKRKISLIWQKPESVTEAVHTYTISFEGKKNYNSSFVHSGNLSVLSTKKEVTNLYPGTRYTFRVSATTVCGKGDYSSTVSSTTKVDAPPAPAVELVVNITTEANAITVWESSDINGKIVAYQFIVADGNSSIDYTKLKSYEEAKKEELQYYISAELKTGPGKTFRSIFILGDEKEYNGYKNVKFSYGKTFNVLQRALTQDDNKDFLAGPSTLVARGKISENIESSSGKHFQKDTACVGLDFSVFAVSLAFNVAFFIGIVVIAVHNRRLKKQLDKSKTAKSRPVTAYTQDVYANIANSSGEELGMTPLPTQERCTYEQIDLRGTADPSDVHAPQTEVTGPNAIAIDAIGGIYESITEESKPNPNTQIYDTIETETKPENPEQMANDIVSSSQPIYQSLAQENQAVYESLHT